MLRHLPRKLLLDLRLGCQVVCKRVSTILSVERMSRAISFERRLHVPTTLEGVRDIPPFLRRLCRRFAIEANTWSVSLDVRSISTVSPEISSCITHTQRSVRLATRN